MRFTPEQQSAILAENREVLVSAAAGSGKTAVLVERILHLIANKNCSIDRMLVVTYTRAAAAELRERLETRIQEAAMGNPRLARQAEMVGGAQISTIHAYCQKVIREQFRFCQIDPQFTLGDERTIASLYRDSMEEALERLYTLAKESPEAKALVDKLPEKNLVSIADALYAFLMSRPDPLGWLKQQAEKSWSPDSIDTDPASAAFLTEANLILQGAYQDLTTAFGMLENPDFPRAFEDTMDADMTAFDLLTEASQQSIGALARALGQCRFITIARVRPATPQEAALTEEYKALRDRYKKTVQSLRDLMPFDLDGALRDMNEMTPALKGLYQFMTLLMDEYQRRKRDMAVINFEDLEHMTLAVLRDPELRQAESNRFDAIFVDEYQDVSAIQEEILNSLKRPAGEGAKQYVFYVGDVKQSIYRFRLAEPRLFLDKMAAFSPEEKAEQRKIILNRNFRSRVAVLEAVNRTFRHVMDARVTEIDYDPSAWLYPGTPSQDDPEPEVHFLLTQTGPSKATPIEEAELIARDILSTVGQPTIDGEGNPGAALRYRDIAILMPQVKGVGEKVEATLAKAGIPVYVDAAANALGGDEVIQAVEHLTLLDNPMNDTALIAELRSPLFEMTEEELCRIRLEKPEKEASFLDALTFAAESAGDPALGQRCQRVLATLKEERFLYRNMPVADYLWGFLSRSGLYAYYGAQPGGKTRQANLRMLCLKAQEYAEAHKEGLSGFLESIREKKAGDGTSPTVVSPWEDVVRIMTIHKSKGLEFPTVYLMGLGTTLNRRRQTRAVSMHGELGLGLMYMNEKARTKRTTFLQSAIQLRLSAEERAEKARLLYVAMTRAKSRLVMIGSCKQKKQGLKSPWEIEAAKPKQDNDLSGVRFAGSYLDWLEQTLRPTDLFTIEDLSTKPMWENENDEAGEKLSSVFPQKTQVWKVFFHIPSEESSSSYFEPKVNNEFLGCLAALPQKSKEMENCIFSVPPKDPLSPCPDYVHLPLKLGVTALCQAMAEKGSVPAGEEAEETVEMKRMPLLTQRPRLMSALSQTPSFILPKEESLPAQRGSATHRLLELLPLDGIRKGIEDDTLDEHIKKESEAMAAKGILTAQEASMIDLSAVAGFFRSDLGARMLRSPLVRREWSFTLKIKEPLETMVQGVIDLCFEENGHWVLLDFKTDRVHAAAALWERYASQLAFYKKALEKATPLPVGEMGLYSLAAKEASMKKVDDKI